MSDIRIPLSQDEVDKVLRASAYMNKAHNQCKNAIDGMAAEGDELTMARYMFPLLEESAKMLLEIRRDLQVSPNLTIEHLGTLEALRSFPQEMSDLALRFPTLFAEVEKDGREDMLELRHQTLGTLIRASFTFRDMMKMIDAKAAPLSVVNQTPGTLEQGR